MKHVYLVRHGETAANVKSVLTDTREALNETGVMQAVELSERTQRLDFDKVVSSHYVRAKETAEIIAKGRGKEVDVSELFGEIRDPKPFYDLSESDERVRQYWNERDARVEDPEWRYEGGENWHDIFTRTRASLTFLEKLPEERILVVSHAMFLRALAATMLLNPPSPSPEWLRTIMNLRKGNAGISLCALQEGNWKVLTWNDHAHFAE